MIKQAKSNNIYWKCYKCGTVGYTEKGADGSVTCVAPMPVRTSGICGGGYVEITEQEYNELKNKTEEI